MSIKSRIYFTVRVNSTNELLFNKVAYTLLNNVSELDNYLKELTMLRNFINGEVNRKNFKLSDVTITITDSLGD
jgi:hypothetical protein